MSYLAHRQDLGFDLENIEEQVKDVFDKVQPALELSKEIIEDPYLPETMCRVLQLSDLEEGKPPRTCGKTPMGHRGGIGLRHAIRPLRGYVWARENPAKAAAIATGAVGSIFLLGYLVGR